MSETRATYNVTPEPMQPGRELDALAAKVMGHTIEWRWCVRDPECYGQNHSGFNEVESIYDGADEAYGKLQRLPCIVTIFNNGDKYYQVCFPYSTDAAAAMEAWAWLEANNPWESEEGLFLGRYTDAWKDIIKQPAVMRYVGYEEIGPVAVGTTYPHAISLAILEAAKVA